MRALSCRQTFGLHRVRARISASAVSAPVGCPLIALLFVFRVIFICVTAYTSASGISVGVDCRSILVRGLVLAFLRGLSYRRTFGLHKYKRYR